MRERGAASYPEFVADPERRKVLKSSGFRAGPPG